MIANNGKWFEPFVGGERFGTWTVIREYQPVPGEKRRVLCICDCGNVKEVTRNNLVSGRSLSCGERGGDYSGNRRLGAILADMKQRCYNPTRHDYKYYGARGIAVCDEWLTDVRAFKIWALANGYEDTLTIDRIDNDGNYSPDNCRWLTASENVRHPTRKNGE